MAGRKAEAPGNERLPAFDGREQRCRSASIDDVLGDESQEIDSDTADGHGRREAHATHHEGDHDEDRDRDEHAELHERPNGVVEPVSERIDRHEQPCFADGRPSHGNGG
jgi:hypothetical protein